MGEEEFLHFPCELCGGSEFAEIPEARLYMDGQPIHVCKRCGLVQVTRRRLPEQIAEVWAKDLYQAKYTAQIPAVKARQVFVAETIDSTIGITGKSVCDIGAGEGYFLEMLRKEYGTAGVFGLEPSSANCDRMTQLGIDCFDGTIEAFAASEAGGGQSFDLVTIIWTLENCSSCRAMADAAWRLLKPEGHVVLATGSRVLVPFKKPLDYYLGANPADTHAFRFSANTLNGLLAETGFRKMHANRYIDNDVLCMIATRTDRSAPIAWQGDDYRRVLEFFARWHADTLFYGDTA